MKQHAEPNKTPPARPARGRWWLVATTVTVGVIAVAAGLVGWDYGRRNQAEAVVSRLQLKDIPFNGARAYEYLKQICQIGPRRSGSEGMAKQQKLLKEHFEKLGATVRLQKFTAPDPRNGQPVAMANLIVHWKPERTERILLCTHYDTLPYPLMDRHNPRGRFVGANDGGSGVALLMELGNEMAKLDCKYGIDFVFFDAEEYIFNQYYHPFFLGSTHFARDYKKNPPKYRYRCGILLDMIGDADLQLFQEQYSAWWSDTRPLVRDIWSTAGRLGVREFIARPKHEVRDDHVPLHDIAQIPTIDIIDFDYPPWHTQGDTVDKCSALSLAKVGWVLREWLKAVQ
ncbi:MAG: M28 family peptidase [Pirellulales bacterium]|nr:M28 family peptidase [Pirellulales bacterium]